MLTEDVGWEALKMSYCIASETYWNLDAIEWWLISTHTTRFMIFLFSPAGRQGLGCFELREEWLTSPWENKTEQRPWFVPVAGGSFFSRQLRYVHVTPIVHIMNFEIYIYILIKQLWISCLRNYFTHHPWICTDMHRLHSKHRTCWLVKKHRIATMWIVDSAIAKVDPAGASIQRSSESSCQPPWGFVGWVFVPRSCHSSRVWRWKGWSVQKRCGRRISVAAPPLSEPVFFFHLPCAAILCHFR